MDTGRRVDHRRQKAKKSAASPDGHEFRQQSTARDQVGWDWFSIQLDNQSEMMLYLMRRKRRLGGSLFPAARW